MAVGDVLGAVALVVFIAIFLLPALVSIWRKFHEQCQACNSRTPPRPPSATQRPAEMASTVAATAPPSSAVGASEIGMEEVVVVGQVVTGLPVEEPAQTLTQQVELLRTQLGISGGDTPAAVVHHAATQLGIDAGDRPLIEISRDCVRALGGHR